MSDNNKYIVSESVHEFEQSSQKVHVIPRRKIFWWNMKISFMYFKRAFKDSLCKVSKRPFIYKVNFYNENE